MKSSLIYFLSILISVIITGAVVGTLSAFFLNTLDWVTEKRLNSGALIYLLPAGGAIIGFGYYFLEKGAKGGNNLLINEMVLPHKKLHWKMTPLVLLGTLLTHLFGGSAGREGTAVQMGGATADQFNGLFSLPKIERKLLLRLGVAAGFSGVFGTPIGAIFFALEFSRDRKLNFSWVPALLAVAHISHYTCLAWNTKHTSYRITEIPNLSLDIVFYTVLAGIIFGVCALLFSLSKTALSKVFERLIKHPPYRPILGGILLTIFYLVFDATTYSGLGISTIESAFTNQIDPQVFIIKLALTALTLAAGFKGGEATPLFFMGATLGSFLILFIPLPLSLLAGLGFIAVFSGATNTPFACTAMGCELFGWDGVIYFLIVSFVAYLISGNTSVYKAQQRHLKKPSFLRLIYPGK
jgi:H+/Cl- antiporter ClcA